MESGRLPARRGLLRVVWLPGSDLLEGTCHCGAVHVAEGPVEVWQWLLGHPTGHDAPTDPAPPDAPTGMAHPGALTGRADPGAPAGTAPSDALSGTGAAR
ncbi:hypothetical protein ACIBI9_37285 [Nonomuraea sp. NPDC050451]|uniref:hypothetical protein n=1 Tax=Nonomuraea sp. NPDC050451 TaxID=3364364 RepID=UPI0037BC49BB